jgi:hypothetical protein
MERRREGEAERKREKEKIMFGIVQRRERRER